MGDRILWVEGARERVRVSDLERLKLVPQAKNIDVMLAYQDGKPAEVLEQACPDFDRARQVAMFCHRVTPQGYERYLLVYGLQGGR